MVSIGGVIQEEKDSRVHIPATTTVHTSDARKRSATGEREIEALRSITNALGGG